MAGRHAGGGSRGGDRSAGDRSGGEERASAADGQGAGGAAWWEALEDVGSARPSSWPLAAPGSPGGAGGGTSPGTPPGPAPRVPGWEVERFLGRGGSGEVWRAREAATGEPAALKVLRASVAGDAGARRRLEDEAALMAALDAPHLVRLRGLAQTDEAVPRPVLVLDHAPGASLAALVAERGALDPGEVVTVLVPLAGVLADLHATGVVHGDVAPGNLLFAEDGRPLLADLGTAGLVACGGGPSPGRSAVPVELTTGYADAERAAGGPATPEGDVHALGACAWHALTALEPGPPSQRPPLVTLRPDAPRALVDLVEDCLEADPGRRPDARALARRAWETAEAEPVRLVPTDPCAPPDEVITHRVRAAALRPAPEEDADEHVGRRWGARLRRRPVAATSVLAAVGVLAAAALLVLVLPLLGPGPLAGTPVARDVPAPDPGAGETAGVEAEAAAVVAGGVGPTGRADGAGPAPSPAEASDAAGASAPARAPDPAPAPGAASAATAAPAPGAVDEAVLRGSDPVAAVPALAGLRAHGFAARDGSALARAAAPGSPALAEDLARLDDLTQRRARLAHLRTEVLSASLAAGSDAGGAVVDVVSRTSAHDLVADDGRVLAHVPEGEEVPVRLRLVREGGAWRVQEVLAPT